jgi:ribosomal protein S3
MSKKKKSFAQKLAKKLEAAGIGEVEIDRFDDGSGSWVSIHIGGAELCIGFNDSGTEIEDIGLYVDKTEVVDQDRVWGSIIKPR